MGVLATKLLGYTIIFGGVAVAVLYATNPGFRDQINQIIGGTSGTGFKWTWRTHITNQG